MGSNRVTDASLTGAWQVRPFVAPRSCAVLICASCLGTDPNPGFEAIHAVAGPMARSVSDLERMSRVLFGARDGEDSYFPAPIPYRDVKLPEKLRFGYYLNGACYDPRQLRGQLIHVGGTDKAVKGSPATHRAMLETVQALRAAGHECVEIDSPDCASNN